jgi:hypothetical protein
MQCIAGLQQVVAAEMCGGSFFPGKETTIGGVAHLALSLISDM